MVDIYDRDGIAHLNADDYSMKIDNNRYVYIKNKNDSIYRSLDTGFDDKRLPEGMKMDSKKRYLRKLYDQIEYEKKQKEVEGE